MNLHGGAPQVLTQDNFHSVCPSWSHDAKWIYFGSVRSGDWQVWKLPAQGGRPCKSLSMVDTPLWNHSTESLFITPTVPKRRA